MAAMSIDTKIAFAFNLSYDSNALNIDAPPPPPPPDPAPVAYDPNFLLAATPGANIVDLTITPDVDGEFEAGTLDLNTDTTEFGSGVLARITIKILGSANNGVYDLTLSEAAHIDPLNDSFAPTVLNHAKVAVGQSCPFNYTGDVDCNLTVNSVDALKLLRNNASLPVTEDCVGSFNGDVDCSGISNAVDALKILRDTARGGPTAGDAAARLRPGGAVRIRGNGRRAVLWLRSGMSGTGRMGGPGAGAE